MSLLLDALKKAAEDKQKSSASADAAEPARDETPADQEIELELDDFELPEEQPETQADEGDNPLIIEDSPAQGADSPEQDELADELPELHEQLPEVEDLEASARHENIDRQVAELPPEPDTPIDPVPQAQPESEPAAVSASDASAPASPANKLGISPPVQPKPRPSQAKISSRQALDMMINKSRDASEQRNRLIRNLSLLMFVLILAAGGGYFYFDSQQKVAQLQRSNQQLSRQLNVAQAEPVVKPEMTQSVSQPAVLKSPAKQTTAAAPPSQPVAKVSPPVAKKPAPRQPGKTMQISRKSVQDPVDVLLTRAYEKFNAGDYQGANQLYQQVQAREPKNRDGLLGLAAVAMKQQRYPYAQRKYQTLLELDPKDGLARAGLSAIDRDVNSESRLKFMLREQPDSAALHFALGSLYASQQRWPEAQQAFFSAWTGDASNADYAYNLAISLDQMGKYPQALSAYRNTLKLASGKQVEFSIGDVQARIEQLGKLADE